MKEILTMKTNHVSKQVPSECRLTSPHETRPRNPWTKLSALVAAAVGMLTAFHPACAQSWIPTPAPNLNWTALASSADGAKLVAVANDFPGGAAYLSTDSGVTWNPANAPSGAWPGAAALEPLMCP